VQELFNPLVWLVHLSASTSRSQAKAMRAMGVPVLMGTETGLKAVAHLMAHAAHQRALREGADTERSKVPSPTNLVAIREELSAATISLDEHTSKRILAAYGLEGPREKRVGSRGEAAAFAREIGYPVVLKTAIGASHKTERGGVRVDLRDEAELRAAYDDFERRLGPEVLVQEMVGEAPELLLGLVNDAQFGPMLLVGSGGVFAEVLEDFRLLTIPVSERRVREALLALRAAPLLGGFRGGPVADLEAVVRAALGLGTLAEDLADWVSEVDINPLRVMPRGAVVVDALIVPRAPGPRRE